MFSVRVVVRNVSPCIHRAGLRAMSSAPSFDTSEGEASKPQTYKEFMEQVGCHFKTTDQPNNWLSRVPFPMNESFQPPPPLSNAVRRRIWDDFMRDPVKNDVRALSDKYHLSLKRVDAILRLQGLEVSWVEGKPLQTGFEIGMERILGSADSNFRGSYPERNDTHRADQLEQDENRDAARQRYVRSFWESVPIEGQEPITPASLEKAKQTAKYIAAKVEAVKSGPQFMPRLPDTKFIKTPQQKIQQVNREGRPTLEFVDVGGKFIDVNERLRRISVAQRRARVKSKKVTDKEKKTFSSTR